MEFKIERTVYVEVENVANRFQVWLDDILRDDLGYEPEEIEVIDENAVLKAVGQYWLNNLH